MCVRARIILIIYFLHMGSLPICMCTMCMPSADSGKKKAPDLPGLELQMVAHVGLELNLGPLEEWLVLLTVEPASSLCILRHKMSNFHC